jgi:uncharacterized protein YlxW (UPF0749 family)
MRELVAISLLCFTLPLLHAQQTSTPAHPSATRNSNAPSPDDAQATREDIQRMKALVQQMQTNLAFVTTTQNPLKHQFELEIQMWQLEIARMERRLDSSEEKK